MKVGICHRKGSFSDRWIEYLKEKKIPFLLIDPFDNHVISKVVSERITHCMWHFDQNLFTDMLHARNLFHSLKTLGIKTFPNEDEYWHFDDKVAQKYLLEALQAPLIKTDVFFDKEAALNYVRTSVFPKVFKLRGGAGSINVQLVRNKKEGRRIVNKAFGRGFKSYDMKAIFNDTIERFLREKNFHNFSRIVKWGWSQLFVPKKLRIYGRQKGYVYFQEFIPNLEYDIRLIVIGGKCFYLKRYTRDNDFRASGSGRLEFQPDVDFDRKAIEVAFEFSKKLNMSCVAYDFVFFGGKPYIVEISYGFQPYVYDQCVGYFDSQSNWVETEVNLEYSIIETFLN